MTTRAIATYAVGPHTELLEIAMPSFERFAERHGYDLIVPDPLPSERAPSWHKVPILLSALDEYDEVLWLDADTVVVDPTDDVPVLPQAWQAMVRHYTGDGMVPNCGVWLVRRPMIPVLQRMWNMSQHIDAGWWEQSALCELLGYDVRRLPIVMVEPSDLYSYTQFLDSGWNVHVWDANEPMKIHIQHATMHPDRKAVMTEWASL